MKISDEEIQEEIKNSTKEQDILRRVFSIIKESHWDDHKTISSYGKSFGMQKSLGEDINAVVQQSFPKWYTKQIKIHKSRKITTHQM